jgi:electron transport complex protein RnfD
MNKLIVSLSPHVHSGDSIQKNMYGVLIALLPALICSFIFFGLGAILITCVSVASCVFFEWAINRYLLKNRKNTVTDGSAIITGVLLAMNVPSNLPLWIIIIGALFAIGVVKMTFGGLGCNLFNPALAGRAFLLISFPVQMTTWPTPGQGFTTYLDAETGATPLALFKAAIQSGDTSKLASSNMLDMLVGNTGGAFGEVCEIAILIGLVYMLVRKIITWHIPVSILVTSAVCFGLLHLADPAKFVDPGLELISGGLLLGSVFMATDYVTSPMTPKGQLIYGAAIGFLTVVIRTWGAYPEGVSFAILIMNAFTPLINTYCKPKRFGAATR